MSTDPVLQILAEAKKLAQRYRALTGKPLGITGEVAEYEAARILGVELTPARQAGYDAIETRDGQTFRLQIKGRCVLEGSKPGQRMGAIDIQKEFDAVLLVLLDGNYEGTASGRNCSSYSAGFQVTKRTWCFECLQVQIHRGCSVATFNVGPPHHSTGPARKAAQAAEFKRLAGVNPGAPLQNTAPDRSSR